LVGTHDAPLILDVRSDDDRQAEPRLLPGSVPRDYRAIHDWGPAYSSRSVVVACSDGRKVSQGVAAWLRQGGTRAEYLEGGVEAWGQAGGLTVRPTPLPQRDAQGRTVWVTRARPKIDRIACPWLIRRFVDPDAKFLFVAASEVLGVAERFGATPFDLEGIFWSHRGEACTFDVMLQEFALDSPALNRLAAIVRGADTNRLDIAPEAAGLLATSLGLSRMYRDDLAQLEAAMSLYDALYRWARDATGEGHTWPPPPSGARS
jgi:rhodanese-related sulfurtransferase